MLMNATLTIMATGYTCVRRFLCLFNLLIWLTGSCILGIGIWLYVSYDTYARILPSYHVLSADNLAIFIGALTFFVAFCGCCGSWFQSKYLLAAYLGSIIFIMLVEVLLGILCFTFQAQIGDTLQNELLNGIQHRYFLNDTNGIKSTWDHIQTKFHCCGVNNRTDWYRIDAWPEKDRVPASCCKPPFNGASINILPLSSPIVNDSSLELVSSTSSSTAHECGLDAAVDGAAKRIWRHGCFQKIRFYLLTNIHGVGIASIVFAFVQFVSLVSAFLVIYTIDYKKDRRKAKSNASRSTYNRIRTL